RTTAAWRQGGTTLRFHAALLPCRPLSPLYFVPQLVQLLETRPPDLQPPLCGQPLDLPEAPGELVVRPRQRGLRVDVELAREIYDGEQEIAYLFLNGREWGAGSGTLRRSLRFPLANLLFPLFKG